jgi:UDPglucose 6-dehydrogenase
VLGLAFKGGTDDVRESPAIGIIESLLAEGVEIQAFDPAAVERAREVLPDKGVRYVTSAYEAADSVDALLVLTEWDEFKTLNFARIRRLLRYPIVVDGRNLFRPDVMAKHGFIYLSMGRPDVLPPTMQTRASRQRLAMGIAERGHALGTAAGSSFASRLTAESVVQIDDKWVRNEKVAGGNTR